MHVHASSQVWVRRPASAAANGATAAAEWAPGVVKAANEGATSVVVRLDDGQEVTCALADVELRGEDKGVQDLIRLSHLNEPSVLAALSRRYTAGDIYTHTGSGIIIAVNPFAPMPHLYDASAMEAHRTEGADGDAGPERPPHVFSVASQAYWRMRREGKGQALLVTGESGAGKTETSKLIMKYLAYLGGYKLAGGDEGGDAGRPSVEQRVLESNPLLEAFGNAKTVRNDNSSRFGKYIELHFCAAGSISGARIHTYLLERSRLVAPSKGERNYHILYQLLAGAAPDERARWRLGPGAASHRLTSAAGCLSLPGVDDAREFAVTRHAMRSVGLGGTVQEQIFQLLAALLHLGDVEFSSDPDHAEAAALKAASEAPLAAAAQMLGCEAGALRKALTTRTRVTPDGPIVSPLAPKAAAETRDALAKVVYARLFDWLVARINEAVGEDQSRASTIGLLDIYGFESFEYNDLEQFCINLANEKLQQHFNHHVFKQEQAAYEAEGIDWSYIDFVDNQDVLDLMEGRMGLMDLIDEACRFPTATPRDLADKLFTGAAPAASARFSRAKKSTTAFRISHYAGPVTYQTDHMLDKNRDFVISEHQALLAASSCPLARRLFADGPAAAAAAANGGGGSPDGSPTPRSPGGVPRGGPNLKGFQFVSVGSQFKRQLAELAAKLSQLQPHYVRCIKPNPNNEHMRLDKPYALEQLKCGGVMEAVRISNAGYPLRKRFGEFVDAFWPLSPALRGPRVERRRSAAASSGGGAAGAAAAAALSTGDDRAAAEALLRGLCKSLDAKSAAQLREGADWQIGRSQVFMRAGAAALLARLHAEKLNGAAAGIQAGWRGVLARREAARRRAAAVRIQAGARGALARAEALRRRRGRAAAALQAAWRGRAARTRLGRMRAAALLLQSAWRARAARLLVSRLRRAAAAVALQSAWRGLAARRAAAAVRGAVALQSAWRGRAARAATAPLLRRRRAAVTIQSCWRMHRVLHPRYSPEHHAAAALIQELWRDRAAVRREGRLSRLRNAFMEYAARWHAAVTLQAAWRARRALALAHHLREERRRATFRKHAAMFQTMAAAAATAVKSGPQTPPQWRAAPPPPPLGSGTPPGYGGFGGGGGGFGGSGLGGGYYGARPIREVATSVFRIMANGGGGPGKERKEMSIELQDMRPESRRAYAEVVKCDASAYLEKPERLQHRGVGELRDRAKVTSLLGIWQQRLAQQQQRQRQQQQRQHQLRQRQQQVWQRQQQLLKHHQARQQMEEELAAQQQQRMASPLRARLNPLLALGSPRML